MFRLILTIFLFTSLHSKDLQSSYANMSVMEHNEIYIAYVNGLPYDFGLTLAAICWQESTGGRYQISTDYQDFGLYHINIYWYLKEIKVKDTIWNRSKYSTRLMNDRELCLEYILLKLQRLRLSTNGNYIKIWERYNGTEQYALDIQEKVKFLKTKLQGKKNVN